MHRYVILFCIVALLAASGCGGSEARKEKALERGQELLAERDYAKARVEFRNALQIDPKDAAARTLLGEAAEALGSFEEAVNSYRAALELDPGQVRARARLARMMVFGGVPDEALALIAPGLEMQPQSADLLAVRGAARLQQGELEAARSDARAALAVQPNHPDATALLATLLWREDERDEALALLERTVEASPDDAMLRPIYAQLLLTAEKPELAEAQLREIVRLEPKELGHRYRLAQLYASQKKPDLAAATLREAVEARPDDVQAKLALANLRVAQGSFEDAEQELLTFTRAAPKDLELRLGLARFYEMNGRLEEGERAYRAIVEDAGDRAQGITARSRIASIMIRGGRVDEAAQLVDEVLAKNPSDADALVLRAQIAMQRGDTNSAIGDLRAALRDQPTNILLVVQLAQAYIRAGNVELAEQTLRQAVQANPRDAQTRLALAQFLVNKGEAPKARPVLEQLVADDPNNVEALEGLARLQLVVDDPSAALQTAGTLQAVRPKAAAGYFLAGVAQLALGREEDARDSLEQAVSVDPAWPPPYGVQARALVAKGESSRAIEVLKSGLEPTRYAVEIVIDLATMYSSAGRHDDAIKVYEGALERNPNDLVVVNNLAMLLATHRTDAASLEAAGQLVERFSGSENPAILDTYGWVLYKRGRYVDAVLSLEKAVAMAPESQELRYHLGMAQLKAGKPTEARKNLEAALQGDQEFTGREQARMALEGL